MPATAAILSRETQAYAIKRCEYISAIAAFTPRETQDFASLQGGRHHCFNIKATPYNMKKISCCQRCHHKIHINNALLRIGNQK